MEEAKLRDRSWSKNEYCISTDPSLIPVMKLNKAFESSDVYWALPMPDKVLKETLQSSLCFGLYDKSRAVTISDEGSQFVGFARCITDFTTFVYLTDVYVWPSHQGKGLGKWLISCVQEVIESMPYLRRSMLFTSDWERSVPFYKELMDMELVGTQRGANGEQGKGPAILQRKGNGFPPTL